MTELDDFAKTFKNSIPTISIGRTFYFDESNNIKKAVIGLSKDNNEDLENTYFTLGGIALDGPLDFDELLHYIGGKQKPTDAKFRYFSFGKTEFKEAIKQKRLALLFEYLIEKNILIHFTTMHYMHMAITDILDSLIEEKDINQEVALNYYLELQSDMTEVLFADYDRTHAFLCEFSFPNIPKEKANEFINKLYEIYTDNLEYFDLNCPEGFTKELLRQLIKAKRDKNNLLFLEDNEPMVVFENIAQTYLIRTIQINDKKVFDEEGSVIEYYRSTDSMFEKKLDISFENSKNSREIQISDAICGFVAKLYNFLSHNSTLGIVKYLSSLETNSNEMRTLKAFSKLMSISDRKTRVMFQKIVPLFIERRFTIFNEVIDNIGKVIK